MDYRIETRGAFCVMGQEVKLAGTKTENVKISSQFWQTFNQNLKRSGCTGSPNWVKYALLQRRTEGLFYTPAVPLQSTVPPGFFVLELPAATYLVTQHRGPMRNIYSSYETLYRTLLPNSGRRPAQQQFLHFERYDDRFYWNRESSILELWVPVEP